MKSKWTIVGSILAVLLLSLVIAVTLTAPQSARANPGVLYAAPTAQGSCDCSSWANACPLQYALSQAISSDEIWVKAGVHYPGANRTDTFTLKSGVALYGGFAGTETSRSQRNWQTHKTILSGDIDHNDTDLNGNGIIEPANGDAIAGSNAYHVVTGGGTDSSAVLDGFFITAGQANGSDADGRGGGMFNYENNPTLTNVTFSGNTASHSGGGMYNTISSPKLENVTLSGNSASYGGGMLNYDSSPTLTNVTFSGNSAGYYGGGMFNYKNNPTLTNVTFSNNSASSRGGGMYNSSSSPTLTNVTFSGNSASDNSASYGGGMYNEESSSPTLTNVTFSGNTASSVGGGMYNTISSPKLTNVTFSANSANSGSGMYNFSSSPTLTNVTFSGNSASSAGGGMDNASSSNPTLTDVTFSGNSAIWGGGMYNYSSSPTLTNVTFSGNSASNNGGGMYNSSSNPTLTNVIMWGNTATDGRGIYNASSTPLISYSNIQSCGSSSGIWVLACGTDGGGNIAGDPRFEDADGADNIPGTADDNLRLQLTSPAIDAGKNAAVPAGVTTDLDGNPRFVDIPSVPDTGSGTPPIVDMGAYEARPKVYLPLVVRNY